MQRLARMSSALTEPKEGIEQVREILVGAIHRDLEQKLVRLESRVLARVAESLQEARRRMDVVELHLRTDSEKLTARVTAELAEIRESLRAITRDQRETTSQIELRIAKLEETLARGQHELREQMLDQAKTFIDELGRAREELTDRMSRELGAFENLSEEPPSRDLHEDVESPH